MGKNKVESEELKKDLTAYIGGSGFATSIICGELDPLTSPFDPKNPLVFATGPLTGTMVPMASRHVVAAKSPLTGMWGEADSGGFWATELKFAGFDAVIVRGASATPTYLWIHDGEAEIKKAEELTGLSTYETENELKKIHGKKTKVASIGPAGENLVKYALVANDGGRMAGRTGMGAVMGSKKLKAIAVNGGKQVEVSDPNYLKELRQQITDHLRERPGVKTLSTVGTGANLERFLDMGNLPLKNWALDMWSRESVQAISKIKIMEKIPTKRKACFNCPVACGMEIMCGGSEGHGPEYETLAALGSLCLIDNPDDVIMGNDLCNRYGIDTIETGATVAMAMECYEKGILTEKDLGMKLEWGNGKALAEIIPLIARREGFGNTLAEGVKGAAEKIGGQAPEFAMHVRGASIPMHDPRVQPLKGLSYATLPMGAYHGKGGSGFVGEKISANSQHESVNEVIWRQNMSEIVDCLVMCSFAFEDWAGALPLDYIPKLLLAVTGWVVKINDLYEVGGRIFGMKRKFIEKIGIRKGDEQIPKRFEEVPRVRKEVKNVFDVKPMLRPYYEARGWKSA